MIISYHYPNKRTMSMVSQVLQNIIRIYSMVFASCQVSGKRYPASNTMGIRQTFFEKENENMWKRNKWINFLTQFSPSPPLQVIPSENSMIATLCTIYHRFILGTNHYLMCQLHRSKENRPVLYPSGVDNSCWSHTLNKERPRWVQNY